MEYNLAIKKNEFESFLVRWMNLEPVIWSEVSQKEKNKYHTLMHIYIYIWNLEKKGGIEEPICKEGMEMQM